MEKVDREGPQLLVIQIRMGSSIERERMRKRKVKKMRMTTMTHHPRRSLGLFWSIELQGKFVAAVNQLGIERAVPKRILDLMNVEGITRENVANHLQKYGLYLKRISSVATQQANIVTALGGKDSSYMRMSLLDGLRD